MYNIMKNHTMLYNIEEEYNINSNVDMSNKGKEKKDVIETIIKNKTDIYSENVTELKEVIITPNKEKKVIKLHINNYLSVSVLETLTAGAVSNLLCNKLNSSSFFYGCIIAYNMKTQRDILGISTLQVEENNFANPYTAFEMAKIITKKFNSRIGISNTGFSLPFYRNAEYDINNNIIKSKIDVKVPYAHICIYDSLTEYHKIYLINNNDYDIYSNRRSQMADMQVMIAKKSKEIYIEYCNFIKNKTNK